MTATYSLTVTVTDENDVVPSCTKSMYAVTIDEDSAITTSVAQITCTDSDAENPNNVINDYTIVSGNTGNLSQITAKLSIR